MDDAQYKDDDLVYVDPRTRTVIGKVEWSNGGKPKSLPMKEEEEDEDDNGKRRRRQRYYPWGTFRSMKRLYKIGERKIEEDRRITLDEAIEKSSKEPFWN